MEKQFTDLAPIYDQLMATIPYGRWVEYVLDLADRERHTVRRVLDVGCGTGSAALLLARRGFHVVGFDASADMITEAHRKGEGQPNASFHVMPMQALELPERFDTAISLFDTVNYVTEPSDLQEAFRRVHAHLEPDGLFLFDMNTPYALEMELFTQDNLRDGGEPKYVWKSRYDWRTRMATVDMTFYVKQGNTRVTVKETHKQRAYTMEEVAAMLRTAGFDVVDQLEAFTFRAPGPRTDRAYFVARRPDPKGF